MFNNFWYAFMLSCLVSLSSCPTSTSVVRRPYDKHSKTRRVESTKARPVGRVIRYQIQIKELRQSSLFMGSSSKHSQLTTQQFLLWPSWSELQQATGHNKRPTRAEQHVEGGGGVCVSKRAATWKGSANTRERQSSATEENLFIYLFNPCLHSFHVHTHCARSPREAQEKKGTIRAEMKTIFISVIVCKIIYL